MVAASFFLNATLITKHPRTFGGQETQGSLAQTLPRYYYHAKQDARRRPAWRYEG